MITFQPTERGFQRGEFLDRYRQECSLQESSLATESAIWFGVDVNTEGKKVQERMHLTDEQLKFLFPSLINFYYTGDLTGADANCPIAVAANAIAKVTRNGAKRDKLIEQLVNDLTPAGAKFLTQALGQYHATH